LVKLALLGLCVFHQLAKELHPCSRDIKRIASPVARETLTRDKSSPLQLVENVRQARLVPRISATERRLRNAWIFADQRKDRKPTRADIHVIKPSGKRKE